MAIRRAFYFALQVGAGTTKDPKRCPVWDHVKQNAQTGEGWFDLVAHPQGPSFLGWAICEESVHTLLLADGRIQRVSPLFVNDLDMTAWIQNPKAVAAALMALPVLSRIPPGKLNQAVRILDVCKGWMESFGTR